MNDPNNFNQNPNEENKQLKDDLFSSDNGCSTDVPLWYSVSYSSNGGHYVPGEVSPLEVIERKKRKRRTVLIVSLLLVSVILLSAMAGVGAYLIAGRIDANTPGGSKLPATNNTSTGNLNNMESSANAYTDENYSFAAVFNSLVKNDGSTLQSSTNGSAGANKMSLIDATAAVKDSVVEITATVVSNRGTISAGAGSGVIIHKDGIIVTNNHVIEDCDKIYVRLTNGDTYEAVLRGTDEDGDIAILKITPQESKPLTVAKLGSSKNLVLGEEVIVIGNPLGELGGTVTNGIISATARDVKVDGIKMTLLQTNAAINSGNSGGGLFNMAGELVGVVNAKYSASGVEGLGFAIPIDTAYEKSIKDILQVGYVRGIPDLGVKLVDNTGGNLFNIVYGAAVYNPPADSDFEHGDYIYSIDDTVVYSISTSAVSAIKSILRSHKVGDVVTVVVKRGNEKITLSVTLVEYIPESISLSD